MSTRSPAWATVLLMIFVWTVFIQPVFGMAYDQEGYTNGQAAQPPQVTTGNNSLLCTPFGACEPCPADDMNEPFCQPFGNRRLVHCINTTLMAAPLLDEEVPVPGRLTDGELPAWESCGRIVSKERADFYEFVACNVAFALIALGVLFFRSRRMQVNQARQLAARIGLIRGDGGRVFRP